MKLAYTLAGLGLTFIVAAACTDGGRCDDAHACGGSEVCVDGVCRAGCDEGAEFVAPDTCVYAMSSCLAVRPDPLNSASNFETHCTRDCAPGDPFGSDVENGDCPRGFTCSGLNDGPYRCLDPDRGEQCQGDDECSGRTVEDTL